MCLVRPTNLSIERATYQRVLTDCNILRFYGQEGLSQRRFISYLLTSLDRALFLPRGLAASSMSIALFFCTLILVSWSCRWKQTLTSMTTYRDECNNSSWCWRFFSKKKITRNCCEIIKDLWLIVKENWLKSQLKIPTNYNQFLRKLRKVCHTLLSCNCN